MGFGGPDYLPAQHPLNGKVAKNNVLWLPRDGDPSVLDPVDIYNPLPVQIMGSDGGSTAVRLVDGSGNPVGPTSTARLAANNLALPTAPDVLATLMAYDGATMDFVQIAGGTNSEDASGSFKAMMLMREGGYVRRLQSNADGEAGNNSFGVGVLVWNGANFDRQRSNTEGTLLASAARTATVSSADQVNYNARGVRVFWNVTAVPTIETITPTIEVKDPVSGVYTAILTGAARATTGHVVLEVYPGETGVANLAVSSFLSRTWRVTFTHSASGSWTYSAGYALVL